VIEIFGPLVSPFVVKLLAAADYKGLDYRHQEYVGIRELRTLNPITGKVPVARIDGEVLIDTSFIVRRFDEIQPTPALFSDDPSIAAKQRMLEDWSDESFYWYNQALRWAPQNEPRTIEQNSRFVPSPLRLFAKPLLRQLVGKQPMSQGLGRLPNEMLISEFAQRFDDLVVILGDSPFFYSDQPSVADFAIYGVFNTGMEGGITPEFTELVSQRPALLEWRSRVKNATEC
jgi:glutathione S-transferase